MKRFLLLLTSLSVTVCMAQTKNVAGTYISNVTGHSETKIVFKEDSTFEFYAQVHPVFGILGDFYQYGKWTISGDSIILNPQLTPKPSYQTDFQEEEITGDTGLSLTYNDVTRYFDGQENLIKADTEQIYEYLFAINKWGSKTVTMVSKDEVGRFRPKNVIVTKDRTVVVPRPTEALKSIFINCYTTNKMDEFIIRNPKSNHLTYTVLSNHYYDELRQKKILIKNENTLLANRLFKTYADPYLKLKRVKVQK